jgi:hypothetical protein
MKCKSCNNKKFFVDTLGIEHCSKCYLPTGYLTKATNSMSYKQIELEEELKKKRSS